MIIPGGVLTGIGLGILAMQVPVQFPAVDQNSIFLLCFALGWFLITLLTALFASTQWWALIPGGIMALIGGSLLIANGPSVGWISTWSWPLFSSCLASPCWCTGAVQRKKPDTACL